MKNYKKFFDVGSREAPVLFIFGDLYVGEYIDTHTSLLNKILEIQCDSKTIKDNINLIKKSEIIKFNEVEKQIMFGHLFEKTIYWEKINDKKLFNKIKNKEQKYKHKILNYKIINNKKEK